MKRLFLAALTLTALLTAVALSGSQKPTLTNGVQVQVEERNPWTHLRLNNAPDAFHFAIVSDRTGGHRARIFSQAIEQLNLLQPAFVLSVGDLIEGYTRDGAMLGSQWKEFQGYTTKLQMPFFYLPGNHDVSNPLGETQWQERFGRRYYHFVYRDVLFLMICSDDPAGDGRISKDQVAFVDRIMKENTGVRWTIVALHRPLWTGPTADNNGWLEVEKLLAGRPYTVVAGHVHRFQKFVRQGMNYYQLATTGGASHLRGIKYGEFDHFVWVTMKKEGPLLANVMLDGIYNENMKQPITAEEGVPPGQRKPVYRVNGKVFFAGTPAPDAQVVFHLLEGKNIRRVADGRVEADGSFVLSTYGTFDGAPAGKYAVTVVWRELDEKGAPGPNRLPEKYARPETSGLRAEIEPETNNIVFNLMPRPVRSTPH